MNAKLVLSFVILILAGSILNCSTWKCEDDENKQLVHRAFLVLNQREYDKLDQFIAPDYKRHCQATPDAEVESLDDFRALLRIWDTQMPDAVTKLDVVIAEGDLVAFYGSYSGTQTAPMGPFPATGKKMTADFGGYHRIEGGKIAETWVTWDNMVILSQLGHFPPPAEKREVKKKDLEGN